MQDWGSFWRMIQMRLNWRYEAFYGELERVIYGGADMRTLQRLVEDHAFGGITRSKGLRSFDVCLYLHVRHQPLAPISEHARDLGVAPVTVRQSVGRLVEQGWVYRWKQPGKRGPLIIPWMPPHIEMDVVADMALVRTEVGNYGEWLMKAVLDLGVHDRDYHDNARPQWLTSPLTGSRLELDRWYRRATVAFEFQGPQHSQIGDRYVRTAEQLQQRMVIDQVKRDRCQEYGVRLIEVAGHELSFEHILGAAEGRLSLVPLRDHSPLVRELSGMLWEYVDRHVRRFGHPGALTRDREIRP